MGDRVFELKGKRVFVAGHRGMVGAAIARRLASEDVELQVAGRDELDLRNQAAVDHWLTANRPQVVFLAAARVGGIAANASQPADFLYDNMMIEANVIHAAWRSGVEKLVFLGSTCIYPRLAPQPIPEDALLTGPLEPSNEWYAIAKIAGIKLCQAYRRQYSADFITLQPTNLYGPGDNNDLATSHVLPALLRKAHEARVEHQAAMTVWGTGTPKREFLHVDDLAAAAVFLATHYSGESPVNVGSGEEITIADLARLIGEIVGFRGTLHFDPSRPDGTPRKLADCSRIRAMGWRPLIALRDGIAAEYARLCSGARPLMGARS